MKKGKIMFGIIGALTAASIALSTAGCAHKAEAVDLMADVSAHEIEGKPADAEFTAAYTNFAVKLFKNTCAEGDNSAISPLSVMLALAMTANGAQGDTEQEMLALLGSGDISELNLYLKELSRRLTEDNTGLKAANALWFNKSSGIEVKKDFLQTNADFYSADAFSEEFGTETAGKINSWVSRNSDGMIEKIIDETAVDAVMYLANAVSFDGKWREAFTEATPAPFTNVIGEEKQAQMMSASESVIRENDSARGFIKEYEGGFSFAALLPDGYVDINDWISSLSGEELADILSSEREGSFEIHMPKFSFDSSFNLKDVLYKLGMYTAFDPYTADFSAISGSNSVYIDRVLHKTRIDVYEAGTKAALRAIPIIKEAGLTARGSMQDEIITFDRPFVFAILDSETRLPIFIGTVKDV